MKAQPKTMLLLTLVLTLMVAGCVPLPQGRALTIATATTGGVWHPLGSALGALITRHIADVSADLGATPNLAVLQAALDKLIVRKDAFYAIRVEAVFQQVKVRSVAKQTKPYPALTDALKNQVVFEYQNLKGTLVGSWCPEYVGGVNVPGYHLHFISADRTRGGHLLEGALASAQVSLDETRAFAMALRP
jgi:acetolactate decarboxylase